MMELKEAREIAKRVRTKDWDSNVSVAIVVKEMFRVAVALDDRITELENQIKNDTGYREIKTLYNQIVIENKSNYEKMKQFEAQKDELLEELEALTDY